MYRESVFESGDLKKKKICVRALLIKILDIGGWIRKSKFPSIEKEQVLVLKFPSLCQ